MGAEVGMTDSSGLITIVIILGYVIVATWHTLLHASSGSDSSNRGSGSDSSNRYCVCIDCAFIYIHVSLVFTAMSRYTHEHTRATTDDVVTSEGRHDQKQSTVCIGYRNSGCYGRATNTTATGYDV